MTPRWENLRTREPVSTVVDYLPAVLGRGYVPEARFVLISTGRTGSELLVSLLDSHPEIVCAGELLRDAHHFPAAYVTARAVVARARKAKAFGFKLLLSHFALPGTRIAGIGDPAEYLKRLVDDGYRIVHLARENPVKQALSFVLGMSRQFHYHDGTRQDFVALPVDPVRLLASSWICEAEGEQLTGLIGGLPHLRLSYERHLENGEHHAATVDAVCAYIGVRRAPVRSSLVRRTPRSLHESIENFDDVSALLAGTRFAAFLD